MIPHILKLGPITLHTYGLCLALALIVGHYILGKELARRGQPERFAGLAVTLAAIFGILGARIFDILEHPGGFRADPLKTLFSGSGLTWYGGFLMAAAAAYVAARIKKIPWWTVVDSAAPGLAIGYGFGRLGCFLSGDGCYGIACAARLPFPLCMSFPNGIVPTTEVVYNTPLWEIVGAIFTFLYLWSVRKSVLRPPGLFLRFLIVHCVLRFAVEFVRRNPVLAFGLSQAQVISICTSLIAAVGLVLLARVSAHKRDQAGTMLAADRVSVSDAIPAAQPRHSSRKKGRKGKRKRR